MPHTADNKHHLPRLLKQRVSHLQALHRIGLAMTTTMKASEIINLVLSEVVELTNAQRATVYLVDQPSHRLIARLSIGETASLPPLDMLTSEDLVVEVAHTGKARQYGPERTKRVRKPGESCECEPRCRRLAVPLVAGEEILGVIDLRLSNCRRVKDELQDMLTTLASQAALVLRNASVHEELEQHYREISLLYEIQQEISSTLDYQKVLTLIVERVKRLLNARECTIRLIGDRDGERVVRIAATTGRQFFGPQEIPFADAHIDHQVFGGEMIYMEDVRADLRFPDRDEAAAAGVISMICAPLVARRKILGTIRLYTEERREFSVADRKMLLAVAGQAATAIDHARLYRQVEQKNRELFASYDKLRRTQKELVKNEKLAALGEMAATVAHEIRNPLTSIRGFAQRIARHYGGGADERLSGYTGIIIEEVDRLNKFIKDVLDFGRRVKPSFQKISVNKILSEIITLMRDELAKQNIIVLSDLEMELRETVVDAALIKQMLLNILQNARQAMGDKGILMIKTQNSAEYVRIRIADDGGGIPREILQKVWSPFYTSKVQGTGLGLSLVQRIVDDHHGKIFIRSKIGRGTIVDIFLPVVETSEAFEPQIA